MEEQRAPIIAIVGRPNVGKSTLFNTIVGERKAVVDDTPGVTRDRNYSFVEKRYPIPFHIVDTGGYELQAEDELTRATQTQTSLAVEEADAIIALFDGATGAHPADEEVVALLRKTSKPVRYLVNKCDGKEQENRIYDFYSLGVEELRAISAQQGIGVRETVSALIEELPNYGELKGAHEQHLRMLEEREECSAQVAEQVLTEDEQEFLDSTSDGNEELPEEDPVPQPFAPVFVPGEAGISEVEYEQEYRLLEKAPKRRYVFSSELPSLSEKQLEEVTEVLPEAPSLETIRVALVGRPNVGKSTLLNTLVGEARVITSPIAGTTRDAIDVQLELNGQKFVIVDTAGVRKQARISDSLERYSTLRSLRAIVQSDVAIVIVDATEGPTEQDVKIAGIAHEHGKGIVIAINKWDVVEKDHKSAREMTERVQEAFKFASYAPVLFVSALSGRRCGRLLDEAAAIALERVRRLPTPKLNSRLQETHRRNPPSAYRGMSIQLFYAAQIDVAPITIVLFFNHIRHLNFSYLRQLKNAVREAFELKGSDIKLIPRKR